MPTFDSDKPLTILGVPGRLTHRTTMEGKPDHVWFRQRWVSCRRPVGQRYGEPGAQMYVEIRFDDECGNGHNTFTITATVENPSRRGRDKFVAGGCLHEDIEARFPELAPLIKWHLCSTDGPMHYLANTIYHAGDRDHYKLRKGEKRPQVDREGKPRWELVAVNSLGVAISSTETGMKYLNEETVPLFILNQHYTGQTPPGTPRLEWRQAFTVGEGKERDLDAARSAAIWPDATDEQLMAEPADLKVALTNRLPGLLAAFRIAMVDDCGFLWSPKDYKPE